MIASLRGDSDLLNGVARRLPHFHLDQWQVITTLIVASGATKAVFRDSELAAKFAREVLICETQETKSALPEQFITVEFAAHCLDAWYMTFVNKMGVDDSLEEILLSDLPEEAPEWNTPVVVLLSHDLESVGSYIKSSYMTQVTSSADWVKIEESRGHDLLGSLVSQEPFDIENPNAPLKAEIPLWAAQMVVVYFVLAHQCGRFFITTPDRAAPHLESMRSQEDFMQRIAEGKKIEANKH